MAEREQSIDESRFQLWTWIRRALNEFVGLPSLIAAGHVLVAGVSLWLDQSPPQWAQTIRSTIQDVAFGDTESTWSFVSSITTGLMTFVSIVVSVILVSLQQSTAKLGIQAVNHFLGRRRNQVLFGFYAGTFLFALIAFAAKSDDFNPTLTASLILLLSAAAIFSLVVLIFMSANQMRPVVLIDSLQAGAQKARARQSDLVGRTRRESKVSDDDPVVLEARDSGYIVGIDLDVVEEALNSSPGAELEMLLPIGEHLTIGDEWARINGAQPGRREDLAKSIGEALDLDFKRNTDFDATYNVEHLEMVGWSSVSTAQSNPEVGMLALHGLRELMVKFFIAERERDTGQPMPLVYPDNVIEKGLDAIEALGTVSAESYQFQVMATAMDSIRLLYPKAQPNFQNRMVEVVMRWIPPLGRHFLSRDLERAMVDLKDALRKWGRDEAASRIEAALDEKLSKLDEMR